MSTISPNDGLFSGFQFQHDSISCDLNYQKKERKKMTAVDSFRGPSGEKQISGRNFHKISGQFQDIFGVKTSQ
jgi:hypothetical protein